MLANIVKGDKRQLKITLEQLILFAGNHIPHQTCTARVPLARWELEVHISFHHEKWSRDITSNGDWAWILACLGLPAGIQVMDGACRKSHWCNTHSSFCPQTLSRTATSLFLHSRKEKNPKHHLLTPKEKKTQTTKPKETNPKQ